MPGVEIKPGIYWVGVNDRTTDLFEGLWPIEREGVSYNAYLVKGEKTALIDLAKDFKLNALLDQIAELTDPTQLDYVVINHMEPDHTGVLGLFHRLAPKAQFLIAAKGQPMLEAYYHIADNVRVVADGEELDLGGHRLKFVYTPFLHWPETMMTYDMDQRVLFSCDGFGGYGALQGGIFDDQYPDLSFYEQEALRYYVTILARYNAPVFKALDRLATFPIEVIAPSHGLVWRSNPQRIIELYRRWASYAKGLGEVGVTLLFGTMYGNTERVAQAVAEGVARAGVPVDIFDVRHVHSAYYLPYLYQRRGVIVGAPTYEGHLFPPMQDALRMAEAKRIENRKTAYFGSYGWSGGAITDFKKLAEALKWEVLEAWHFQGAPTLTLLREAEAFGFRFAEAIKQA